MLPSWNRRSSDLSPQKVRNSKACGGTLTKPEQRHRSLLGQTKPSQDHQPVSQLSSTTAHHQLCSYSAQEKKSSPHLRVISLRTLLQRAGSKLRDKQESKCQGPDILVFWGLSINWPLWENEEREAQEEMRFLGQQLLGYWDARSTFCYIVPGAQTSTDRESLK